MHGPILNVIPFLDLLPKFTGQDKTYPVTRWIQDVEENGEIGSWTPLQQLLMARRYHQASHSFG